MVVEEEWCELNKLLVNLGFGCSVEEGVRFMGILCEFKVCFGTSNC